MRKKFQSRKRLRSGYFTTVTAFDCVGHRLAPWPVGRRDAAHSRRRIGQENAHVLDGGDQVILDLLAPEASPARAFEVMIVSRIGKALLHHLLAAFTIAPRRSAVGLGTCYI